MNSGDQYVLQCCKPINAEEVGLGGGWYGPGDYVTYGGDPTPHLAKAHVYVYDSLDKSSLIECGFFKARPVETVTVVRLVPEPKKTSNRTDMKALRRKAYHPSKLTDRELAQVRRSSETGSGLLWKVGREQECRGLLNDYGKENTKRISDYPEGQKSPRIQEPDIYG